MQIQPNKLLRDPSEYEAYPLLETMQAFLDYTTHMATYCSLVLGFMELDEEMVDMTGRMMDYANETKIRYHRALTQQTAEELQQREDNILDEIESIELSLTLCESSLDKYLIFADTQPEIHSIFLTKNGLPLFSAASC